SSSTSMPAVAEPSSSKLKEFRNRLDIPVSVNDIEVTEIGCELRQLSPDVQPCTIPVDESVGHEAVAKILEPWSTTAPPLSRGRSKADGAGQRCKRLTSGASPQPLATLGHEERLCLTAQIELVTLFYVAFER